jgi:hypothetical protein
MFRVAGFVTETCHNVALSPVLLTVNYLESYSHVVTCCKISGISEALFLGHRGRCRGPRPPTARATGQIGRRHVSQDCDTLISGRQQMTPRPNERPIEKGRRYFRCRGRSGPIKRQPREISATLAAGSAGAGAGNTPSDHDVLAIEMMFSACAVGKIRQKRSASSGRRCLHFIASRMS